MGHEVIVQRCVLGKSARGGGPRVQPCGQWFGEARQQRVGLVRRKWMKRALGNTCRMKGSTKWLKEVFVYEGGLS